MALSNQARREGVPQRMRVKPSLLEPLRPNAERAAEGVRLRGAQGSILAGFDQALDRRLEQRGERHRPVLVLAGHVDCVRVQVPVDSSSAGRLHWSTDQPGPSLREPRRIQQRVA